MSTGSPTQAANHDTASASERPAKRRRVAIACIACRERKSRCDGENPCHICVQQSSECSYPPPLSKTDLLRQEFSSMVELLESRVGGIEKALATFDSRLGSALSNNASISRRSATSIGAAGSSEPNGARDGEITIDEDALQSTNQPDNAADGIGIVPLTSREDSAFFGPSSNIAFLRLVSRALAKTSGVTTGSNSAPGHSTYDGSGGLSNPEQSPASNFPGKRGRTSFTMPPDDKARQLISGFFSNCGHVHPYIHEGRFMDCYEEVRRSNYTRVRRSWLALLYIMFSVASMSWPYSSANLVSSDTEADAWYTAASEICLQLAYSDSGVNLEVVQCLVTMVLFLQGTHRSKELWVMLGLAVRLAYQLGLHSVEASKATDPIEGEVRRRVWSGLICLDRTLSMTMGRPPEIPDYQWSMGRPRPFLDSVQRGCIQRDESSVSFLCANLDLYSILNRTIESLYGRNCGSRISFNVDSIARVYTLESDLLQWSKSLSSQLSVMEVEEFPQEPVSLQEPMAIFSRRQKTVITLRYLNARILIHRPVLEGLLDATLSNDPDVNNIKIMRQAGANNISLAVSCAVKAIRIVHRLTSGTTQSQQQLGAWWFTLYWTFNSSLVLLGALLVSRPQWDCPELLSQADRDSACQALQQALEVFDLHDEGHSTVVRCREYLYDLIQVAGPLVSGVGNTALQNPLLSSGNLYSNAAFGAQSMPNVNGIQQPPVPSMRSSPFRQLANDIDLESFMFPMGMQSFGGQLVGMEQPFL